VALGDLAAGGTATVGWDVTVAVRARLGGDDGRQRRTAGRRLLRGIAGGAGFPIAAAVCVMSKQGCWDGCDELTGLARHPRCW